MSDENHSPHTLAAEDDTEQYHNFWADEIADQVEKRNPDEPIVVKGGVSPSGVAHLGNVNEIMRGYFVAEALRNRGHEVIQVFTSDDKDPLRKLPRKLANRDGEIVGLVRSTRARWAGISANPTPRFRTRLANASRMRPTLRHCWRLMPNGLASTSRCGRTPSCTPTARLIQSSPTSSNTPRPPARCCLNIRPKSTASTSPLIRSVLSVANSPRR